MKIFKIEKALGNPGFAFANLASFFGEASAYMDFSEYDKTTRRWKSRSLSSVWNECVLEGNVPENIDFTMTGSLPTFSERSLSSLGGWLSSFGELLPACSRSRQRWYILNVTNVIDVFDDASTDVGVFGLGKYAIGPASCATSGIFRIPQSNRFTYLADEAKCYLEKIGLEGIKFYQVYPPDEVIRQAELEKYRPR